MLNSNESVDGVALCLDHDLELNWGVVVVVVGVRYHFMTKQIQQAMMVKISSSGRHRSYFR